MEVPQRGPRGEPRWVPRSPRMLRYEAEKIMYGEKSIQTLSRLYKLLCKPMAKVMEKGDFRPPTASKPLGRF